MKNLALFSIAIALFFLAAAIAYHAQTLITDPNSDNSVTAAQNGPIGRYQISHVTGLAGVYRLDTATGQIEICSPAYENHCITLENASAHIERQRERAFDAAKKTSDSIDQFTKDRAEDLKSMINKFTPESSAPEQTPQALP